MAVQAKAGESGWLLAFEQPPVTPGDRRLDVVAAFAQMMEHSDAGLDSLGGK
jgi:hypothetical protein